MAINGWVKLVGLVWIAAAPTLVAAQERERTFESAKCRYKLPNDDWAWSDEKMPEGTIFIAANKAGFVVTLGFVASPKPGKLDQNFAKGFESTFFKKGQMEKRGGRFITFQGRPCYQAEGVLADGRTVINRAVLAPGFSYNFAVIGGNQPVEKAPEFEGIVNGLTLTAALAPEPDPLPEQEPLNFSRRMGEIAGYCVIGIIVVAIGGWLVRKSKANG